jgi:hypothetical protein
VLAWEIIGQGGDAVSLLGQGGVTPTIPAPFAVMAAPQHMSTISHPITARTTSIFLIHSSLKSSECLRDCKRYSRWIPPHPARHVVGQGWEISLAIELARR